MTEFVPAWLSFELSKALAPLTRKQRTTVLRLAEARIADRSMDTVFKRADCCARATWYGKTRDGVPVPGWRDDPVIANALQVATEHAHAFEDGRIERAIEKTRLKIAEAGPAAVDKIMLLMLRADSQSLQLRAAVDLLDRIAETASHARDGVGHSTVEILRNDLSRKLNEAANGNAAPDVDQ